MQTNTGGASFDGRTQMTATAPPGGYIYCLTIYNDSLYSKTQL